ncbi:hypothetical protein [Alicyclobacillus ferrooxydans]|nr:hypothetical protein [Alicyclobacillus ferrooxydans]
MRKLRLNSKQETMRHFRTHVLSRKFMARNAVVLLLVLAVLVYQGRPIWYYPLLIILYPLLLLGFEGLIALVWKDDSNDEEV